MVGNDDFAVALTIADNGYMGLDSISLLDFRTGWNRTVSPMRLLPRGKTGLPSTSQKGDVGIAGKGYALHFANDGTTRTLTAHMDDFDGGRPVDIHLTLTDVPRDSMVIATPFRGKPRHFYYNQKINCLTAAGSCRLGQEEWTFRPEDSMAVLDWGRGVWTWRNTWYWSSASGRVQGRRFGFNLGYGFGDTSAASENMLFVDGVAHKLDQVAFEIPRTPEGGDAYLQPWRIRDNEGRLELTFTPLLDRASKTDFLVLGSDQHQVFGRFDGFAVTDEGERLTVNHLTGFAEKVRNKW